MRVLGLDPGTATTGYGFIEELPSGDLVTLAYGVISTEPQTPMPQRLLHIHQRLAALLMEHQPEGAAVEQLFFGKNATTGVPVAQARGVILMTLAEAGLNPAEYKPREVKLAVAGYGDADKVQMQVMIQQLLNLEKPPRPDDAADALAVALTHLNSTRFDRLT